MSEISRYIFKNTSHLQGYKPFMVAYWQVTPAVFHIALYKLPVPVPVADLAGP